MKDTGNAKTWHDHLNAISLFIAACASAIAAGALANYSIQKPKSKERVAEIRAASMHKLVEPVKELSTIGACGRDIEFTNWRDFIKNYNT